jgi:hypothetical protein
MEIAIHMDTVLNTNLELTHLDELCNLGQPCVTSWKPPTRFLVYLEECLSSIRARGAFQKTEWSHLCICRFLKCAPLHVSFTEMWTYACLFQNVHLCMFHFPKCEPMHVCFKMPHSTFLFPVGSGGRILEDLNLTNKQLPQ